MICGHLCIGAWMKKYIDPFKIRLIKVQEEMPKDYTVDEIKALLKNPERKQDLQSGEAGLSVALLLELAQDLEH